MEVKFKPIATIKTDYATKFAVPRQSGMTDTEGIIVFEKEFRDENALKGIEGFSHLWLLWYFSKTDLNGKFKPTVRPPKLGGNKRMGVFATRAPYRPNPIGLSLVQFVRIEKTACDGVVLVVKGADLVDGTPIFDIKPYLPFADCKVDAVGGFTENVDKTPLEVELKEGLICPLENVEWEKLKSNLALDPRPGYQDNDSRVYGLQWLGYDVKFTVNEQKITVIAFEKL